ncbi:hypothetical protein ACH4TV_27805 [Streptomyces sp. NPDC020898]|uniref:hypothetical protein n=1 Tax=Streptomyces sp. NPDC020898 TaxID=3365101 RepID=UPI0037B02A38
MAARPYCLPVILPGATVDRRRASVRAPTGTAPTTWKHGLYDAEVIGVDGVDHTRYEQSSATTPRYPRAWRSPARRQ